MSTPLRERPDAPLGTLIFRAGLLPAETIESALEEGVKTGKRLGEILTERGLLKEVDLARLLAGQKGLEFVTVREQIVDPAAASLFTGEQARLFRALPYAFEDGLPVVAIPDPTDEVLTRNIREALGREEIRFVVSTRGELAEIVEDVYSRQLLPDPAPAPAPAPAEPARVPAAEERPAAEPELAPEAPANGNGTSPHANGLVAHEPAPVAATPAFEPVAATPAFEPVAATPALEPAAAAAHAEEAVAEETPAPPVPVHEPIAPEASPEPARTPAFAADAPATTQPAPEAAPAVPAEPVTSFDPSPVAEPALSPEPSVPTAPDPEPAPVPLPEPQVPPLPAPYPPAALGADATAPPSTPPANGALYRVVIRLTNGERVDAGAYGEPAAAQERAKDLMAQVTSAGQGEWPFVSGRFLKPDTIVSVDIGEHPAG